MNTILVYRKDRNETVVYLDFIQSFKIHQNRIGDPRNRILYAYSAGLVGSGDYGRGRFKLSWALAPFGTEVPDL